MFDGVDLSVEHVLMFVISAFLLYHLMDRCSCMRSGNGFSVGYQAETDDNQCNNELQKVCPRLHNPTKKGCDICGGKNQQTLKNARCTSSDVKEWCKKCDGTKFNDREDLRTAVRDWLKNQAKAEEKYGPINCWDTSSVTDMSYMFSNAKSFDGDISSWDTSSVTNMSYMFYMSSFKGDISGWDTSSVTDMSSMFFEASSFNSNLNDWDTSNVTNMTNIFYYATLFNSNLSDWITSSVTDMANGMFGGADAFNCDKNIIKDTPLYNQCIKDKDKNKKINSSM